MSLTVVNAIMLAALTANQLRLETEQNFTGKTIRPKENDIKQVLSSAMCLLDKKVAKSSDSQSVPSQGMSNAMKTFEQLAQLAQTAARTSVWCTCETSGNNSMSTNYVQCIVCRCSCCRHCINSVAGYNVKSHTTEDIFLPEDQRNHGRFQSKLRQILPPTIFIDKSSWNELAALRDDDFHRMKQLTSSHFSLHRIHRDRRKWRISYFARSCQGLGEAVAELRLTVGELFQEKTPDQRFGLLAEIKSFLPATTEPKIPGALKPCAKLVLVSSGLGTAEPSTWHGDCGADQINIVVAGSGETQSLRAEVGLEEHVGIDQFDAVSSKKPFLEAKSRGEANRWVYPTNWRKWPKTIHISIPEMVSNEHIDVSGDYVRASCRQTVNQSALWIRNGEASSDTLYFLLQPNVNRCGPDRAIISSSSDFRDVAAIIAILPSNWDPCHIAENKSTDVVATFPVWKQLSRLECLIPLQKLKVLDRGEQDVLVKVEGLEKSQIALFERHVEKPQKVTRLPVSHGQKAQQITSVFNACCVSPIMQFFASQQHFVAKLDPASSWIGLDQDESGIPFGQCGKVLPDRPREIWILREDRSTNQRQYWERTCDPGASRKYWDQLHEAPQPFEFWLDRDDQSFTIKYFPTVVVHHAAGNLIGNRGDFIRSEKLDAKFKLVDTAQQRDPVLRAFTVRTCMDEEPTDVTLRAPYQLYDRQKRVVTKMAAIENGEREFAETEICEFEMPGSTGISLMGKVSRRCFLKGGVIADSIGAGKTVISIALILKGLTKSRQSQCYPRNSAATLVLVPPALVDQWKAEIKKFTDDLRVVVFYSTKDFQQQTLEAVLKADVVVCPIDILESPGYLRNLLLKTGNQRDCIVPHLPQYVGQVEQNAARGVQIPNSSTDPYGGANSGLKQQRREESAYYTYQYGEAVQQIRARVFQMTDRGIPLEYFEFSRIFIDEIHESMCTTRGELKEAQQGYEDSLSGFFKEKNRRAGRELLGIAQKDVSLRPLVSRGPIFGLTGTPLLDSSNRVIELANLTGGTYVTGLANHWRNLERESSRNEFLQLVQEAKEGRETRMQINTSCQYYLNMASCRNKVGDEMKGFELKEVIRKVQMSLDEKVAYLESQHGISSEKRSLAIKPEDFDPSAGHDISRFLRQNARLGCRGNELVDICREILSNDPTTKIVVFTDGRIGAGLAARDVLMKEGLGCTWLDKDDTVKVRCVADMSK